MADRITVHGVTGGRVENSNVAGISYGGMSHNHSGRSIKMGDHGQYAEGAYASMNQGAPTVAKKDVNSLSSTELLELVRKYECSDETVKTFADERVTGRLFMEDDLDELLSDLGITKKLDIRKLKSLKDDLSKG